MSRPYQLILDAAGVLITNLSPTFWYEIAEKADISHEHLRAQYKQEIRESLWSGKISEDDFWQWLKKQCHSIEIEEAKRILFKHLEDLPAFDYIPVWSKFSDIHILSNHRAEWIEPLFRPMLPYIKSLTISSEVGLCKPDPKIYELVHKKLNPYGQVWYIDDQEKNLKPAQERLWNTYIADQNAKWIEHVNGLLGLRVGFI
ncbi:haloacid dehalogenase [Paenibacillus polygoni]|uniref:Haloacid dehalogenase n=1 Tax=Paenibacillus polygoni TaxID=3050112 RepID=A0ABY8XA04_9BACL|nr:haloacid dehalogenase [Paenibacillus polygoni]WIV20306.1 haloacid dehalogenase [Paenibacillus polygoni]